MSSLFIVATLVAMVVASELLCRHTVAKHMGTALVVIVLTAIVANLGLVPAGATKESPVPVYEVIFGYVAPISIFWLLLRVNLREILKAGVPMVVTFLLGSLGTVLGVVVGMWLISGPDTLGSVHAALGGMYTGTYTGGSVNFNAIALHYEVVEQGSVYVGAIAVDNVVSTMWMVVTIAIPRLFGKRTAVDVVELEERDEDPDKEAVTPLDLGIVLLLGLGALVVSEWASALSGVPSILWITALALGIAQLPLASKIRGARMLGMFAVYVLLAVIGAYCDLAAFAALGGLGFRLLALAGCIVIVHGTLVFGGARLLGFDLSVAAVASQANIGGGTTALALARSLGRRDLVLPAVLVGSLGTGLGTFLGFLVAERLL